ncbi:MAG: LuxR C-terminal-related transcriptional regulator [Bacteroidota bacterium]
MYSPCQEESKNFNLTRRELEILILIIQGFSSKQIASELSISLYTVKDYRKSLLLKLSAKNCAELCYKAARYNLI